MGAPLDVTNRYSMACSHPFTVCVAFEPGHPPAANHLAGLSLEFREQSGDRRVLGRIGLKVPPAAGAASPAPASDINLFEVSSASILCLGKRHLLAHRCLQIYSDLRRSSRQRADMSSVERRAMIVNFIRPHPVVLVSLVDDAGGNMFPMNLTGELGGGRFGLALQAANQPAKLLEHAGRFAVSTVPVSQGPLAYQLGANHFRSAIGWNDLPFATRQSAAFRIPVPAFALRVREMEVEQVHRNGLHTFFVARVVSDERPAPGRAIHTIHGFYQAWRMRGRPRELDASLVADQAHKCRLPDSPRTPGSGAAP